MGNLNERSLSRYHPCAGSKVFSAGSPHFERNSSVFTISSPHLISSHPPSSSSIAKAIKPELHVPPNPRATTIESEL